MAVIIGIRESADEGGVRGVLAKTCPRMLTA
ncbi:hypothetical protein ES703_82589 [subsurface metagenome]